ncbi:ATP-binding cassette subfamily C protein [Streptomyces zagrosensis]|uniref:ATP-binding cassette subfamily C protein n=1 Tax=Streptomyces zagrosensis TaxID=1042984 RepID=A0A7W9UW74_9ACTN|nr:ATP-binding cassette domain-containing protein [Streptomyces zagrosensis]MBB5933242.1 ATP-binding cassette subfamily C protein [Streptomyces zagrosensis]
MVDAPAPGQDGRPHAKEGAYAEGALFLRRRWRVLLRLAGWSVLEAGQTFLTGYALARALDDGFLAGERATGLGWLGLAALAVVAGAYGTGRVYREVAALVEPLRDGLVRRVVDRAVGDAVRGTAGRGESAAVSRLTHQVEIARDTFAGLVMVSRSFVFVAIGALVGLFSLAPVLLLIVVPPLLAGLTLFAASLRPMARVQEVFLDADEGIATELGQAAAGLRDITAAGAEERVAGEVDVRIDAEVAAARALARWGTLRELALGVGGRLPVVLLLLCTPWLLDRGVTAGSLVGALTYLTQSLLPALQSLIQGIGLSGSRLVVVIRRLAERAAEPPPTPEPTTAATSSAPAAAAPRTVSSAVSSAASPAVPAISPAVSLRAVTFAYGEHAEPVVRDLDLDVPAGGHLAVVGPSGVGKSTLAGLIAGLLVPRGGEIVVCGVPVRGRDAADLAAARVLIPQEAYVFTGTVAENLGYLRAEPVPESELMAAVDAIGLTALVAQWGGPGGSVEPGSLSAGQRQLIALARAYLSPAPVVLLDEATCHLDPAAEARAEQAFARRPGSTLIVIAHRVSSARRADRVLVMDGQHPACGTHEELLNTCALYRDLAGGWSPPADAPTSRDRHDRHDRAGAPPAPPAPCAPGPASDLPAATSQPTGTLRDADGVHPVAGAGLAGDGGHVVAHRSMGQMQTARDVADRGTLGGER